MWTAGNIFWTENQNSSRGTPSVYLYSTPSIPRKPSLCLASRGEASHNPMAPLEPFQAGLPSSEGSFFTCHPVCVPGQCNEANLWLEQKTRFLNTKYDSCNWILFTAPQGNVSLRLLHFLEFLNRQNVCRRLAHAELILAHRQLETARQQGCGVGEHPSVWFPMLVWPHTAPERPINPRVASSLTCWVSAALAELTNDAYRASELICELAWGLKLFIHLASFSLALSGYK